MLSYQIDEDKKYSDKLEYLVEDKKHPIPMGASITHKSFTKSEMIELLGGINKRTKLLTKYAEKNWRLVMPYVQYCRLITGSNGCYLVRNLSTHNGRAISMYGHYKIASRARCKLMNLQVLELVNESYRFCKYKDANRCKTFKFYRDNAELLVEIGKEYNLTLKTQSKELDDLLNMKPSTKADLYEDYKPYIDFKSNMDMNIPTNVAFQFLVENNKGVFQEMNEMIKDLNNLNSDHYYDMRFSPKITVNKKGNISKISSRLCNPYCNIKKEEMKKLNFSHLDINGSIHNISMNLVGKTPEYGKDIYTSLAGVVFKKSETRKIYKEFMNKLYFITPKGQGRIKSFINSCTKPRSVNYKFRYLPVESLVERFNNNEVSFDSKIFLVESYIMLKIAHRLMIKNKGKFGKCIIVYDSIYLDDPKKKFTEKLFHQWVSEYANEYKNKYMNSNLSIPRSNSRYYELAKKDAMGIEMTKSEFKEYYDDYRTRSDISLNKNQLNILEFLRNKRFIA